MAKDGDDEGFFRVSDSKTDDDEEIKDGEKICKLMKMASRSDEDDE